jgi:hypothetical protein
MSTTTTRSDSGINFRLDLETDRLLPGRTATGNVHIDFLVAVEVRGIVASLIATERWQTEETTTDANGVSHTETETHSHELQRLPVMLAGPGRIGPGESRDYRVELPVPPLGPATLEATVCSLTWRIEVKLDVHGLDPDVTADVVVLQPTALLRAGVVDVAAYALYDSVDVEAGDARGSIALRPAPLCVGAPFRAEVAIATGRKRLQEVRMELRSKVRATVPSGKQQEITLWTGRLAGEGEFGGVGAATTFEGTLPALWLPTISLPHGRADAQVHVILAKALAQDTHLVRDVAICSTTEL